MRKSVATTDLENTTDLPAGRTKQQLPPPIVAADHEDTEEVIPGGADQVVESTGTSLASSLSEDVVPSNTSAISFRRNVFQTSYAGRPCGLQGPSQKAGELGLQWLNVLKNQMKDGAGGPSDSRWSEMIQTQKLEIEEQQQQYRQFYLDREAEKTKMSRIDHRHALQQLVVEAFRWRRLPSQSMIDSLAFTSDEKEVDDRLKEEASSLTSPRTMKTVTSLESMGLTQDEEEQSENQAKADDHLTSSPLPPLVSVPHVSRARAADTPSTIGASSSCSTSSTSSNMSSCSRQLWRKKFPLPSTVPEREKADHTTNPLDVADRAMLFGVLDDIDSVMSTSEIGEDGLPQDRYSEVLANLQFLGLFRPKYQEGVDEDDDPDVPRETAAGLDCIDVGLHDDLDDFDLPEHDADRNGIVEIL